MHRLKCWVVMLRSWNTGCLLSRSTAQFSFRFLKLIFVNLLLPRRRLCLCLGLSVFLSVCVFNTVDIVCPVCEKYCCGSLQWLPYLVDLCGTTTNPTTTIVYQPGQPGWAGTKTLRNTDPIHHRHCPQIPHKYSQPSTLGLTVYVYGLILRKTWRKKHEEPDDMNPHFLYTRIILPLVNCWSPLTRPMYFMLYALLDATPPISGHEDHLRICWQL